MQENITGCLMVRLSCPVWSNLISLTTAYNNPSDFADGIGCGIISEPHVTLVYGIDASKQQNPLEVMNTAGSSIRLHDTVFLHKPKIFSPGDYYVVVYEADGPDFAKARELSIEYLQSEHLLTKEAFKYKSYKPHATVCYLKTKESAEYMVSFLENNMPVIYASTEGIHFSFM